MRIRQFRDQQQASLYCGRFEVTLGVSDSSHIAIYTRNLAAAKTIAQLMRFRTVAADPTGKFSFTSRLSADQIKDRIAKDLANI